METKVQDREGWKTAHIVQNTEKTTRSRLSYAIVCNHQEGRDGAPPLYQIYLLLLLLPMPRACKGRPDRWNALLLPSR